MTREARSLLRVRLAFFVAILAVLSALALQAVDLSASPLASEGPTTNIAFNVLTPTDGLTAGSVVQFNVQTTNGVGLNAITAQLCKPGLTSWSPTNYSYSGSTGVRCVKQFSPNGIVAGTELTPNPGTTYRIDTVPFNGAPQTSNTFNFAAGTGSVEWFNAGGFGPNTLTCGAGSNCDMVVQVVTTSGTTYFMQTLTFAGGATTAPPTTAPPTTAPPTTAPPTTSSTTTTTTSSTTTTTTIVPTTTTSTTVVPPIISNPQVPASVSSAGASTGGLALTGASTRDLLSVALLCIALGLFLLGEHERRRLRP